MRHEPNERNGLEHITGDAATAGNKGTRDADTLLLLSEVLKTRANEIDQLLDLSLSIVASANDFPQKQDLEAALKRALSLVRT